jgi:hypothetical protein
LLRGRRAGSMIGSGRNSHGLVPAPTLILVLVCTRFSAIPTRPVIGVGGGLRCRCSSVRGRSKRGVNAGHPTPRSDPLGHRCEDGAGPATQVSDPGAVDDPGCDPQIGLFDASPFGDRPIAGQLRRAEPQGITTTTRGPGSTCRCHANLLPRSVGGVRHRHCDGSSCPLAVTGSAGRGKMAVPAEADDAGLAAISARYGLHENRLADDRAKIFPVIDDPGHALATRP